MPKKKLREEMKARLSAQTAEERAQRSRIIEAKLFSLPLFLRARCIAFFVSMEGEVETRPMIRRVLGENRRVALPRVDPASRELQFFEVRNLERDTVPGTLGILEPVPGLPPVAPAGLDCVIVPGLAFDVSGGRLGRGAGYYDRFLSRLTVGTAKIGIGFSIQMVKSVPRESHDIQLDWMVTD